MKIKQICAGPAIAKSPFMRSLIALSVVLALTTSACATRQQSQVTMGVGGAMMLGGVAMAVAIPADTETDSHPEGAFVAPLIFAGVAVAVAGVIGLSMNTPKPAPKPAAATALAR